MVSGSQYRASSYNDGLGSSDNASAWRAMPVQIASTHRNSVSYWSDGRQSRSVEDIIELC